MLTPGVGRTEKTRRLATPPTPTPAHPASYQATQISKWFGYQKLSKRVCKHLIIWGRPGRRNLPLLLFLILPHCHCSQVFSLSGTVKVLPSIIIYQKPHLAQCCPVPWRPGGKIELVIPHLKFFSAFFGGFCPLGFLTRARPPPGLHLASWAPALLPPVDQTISEPNSSKYLLENERANFEILWLNGRFWEKSHIFVCHGRLHENGNQLHISISKHIS